MSIQTNRFTSIEQVTGQYFNQPQVNNTGKESDISFDQVLKEQYENSSKTSELKFSKHASQRLLERNINLTSEQLDRLQDGAMRSEAKGIKESLVIMDDYAFIVNTENSTVVTAMQTDNANENIYTNIDGAVFV